jgi:hypothetical protein
MFGVAGPEACGRNIAAILTRASMSFHAYGIVSFEVQYCSDHCCGRKKRSASELAERYSTLPRPIGQKRSILMPYPGYFYYISANYLRLYAALRYPGCPNGRDKVR